MHTFLVFTRHARHLIKAACAIDAIDAIRLRYPGQGPYSVRRAEQ